MPCSSSSIGKEPSDYEFCLVQSAFRNTAKRRRKGPQNHPMLLNRINRIYWGNSSTVSVSQMVAAGEIFPRNQIKSLLNMITGLRTALPLFRLPNSPFKNIFELFWLVEAIRSLRGKKSCD